MTRGGLLFLLPLIAAAMLVGCQIEATISVANGPQPRFDVTYDRGKPACVQGLTVGDVTDGTRRDIWAVRRLDRQDAARCVTMLRFGVVPPGYEAYIGGGSIIVGHQYEARASGSGWQAKTVFAGVG